MRSSPDPMPGARIGPLTHWLHSIGVNPSTLRAVSSDASARRYFRLDTPTGPRVAVDAPPATEDNAVFLSIAHELATANVRVPAQYAANLEDGFLLMEDFGDTTFESALDTAGLQSRYDQAIDLMASLHRLPTTHRQTYGPALITRELGVFVEHFLTPQGVEIGTGDRDAWDRFTRWVLAAFASGPPVWTHRDFHCRNLMCLGDGDLGLIDFQGALSAPAGYDLASLLRDCYVDLPHAVFDNALNRYANAMGVDDLVGLRRHLDILGLQRHLKCLGLFTRFAREKGQERYLSSLPRTLAHTRQIASNYSEARIVVSLLERCQTESSP